MGEYVLKWPFGEARILTTAAMLAECQFLLPNGRFSPFAKAPWMGRVTDPAISGHLRELGGDFVCLPFGNGRKMASAPPDWAPLLNDEADGIVHGPAADREWQVMSASDDAIALALDYPDASPVLRVERRISVRRDAPALDFEFRIFSRQKAALPVGLHPIFRLPDLPGRLQLSGEFDFALSHPGYGGQEFQSLAAVPIPGGVVDLSLVPLPVMTDLNVQLCGMRGPLRAIYLDEGAGIELDWERTSLFIESIADLLPATWLVENSLVLKRLTS